MQTFLLTHPVWDVTEQPHEDSQCASKFLLTHPVWDVTEALQTSAGRAIFLLTHPVWDVTPSDKWTEQELQISTHTSRVGCDEEAREILKKYKNFYTHIPGGM